MAASSWPGGYSITLAVYVKLAASAIPLVWNPMTAKEDDADPAWPVTPDPLKTSTRTLEGERGVGGAEMVVVVEALEG